MKNLIQTLEKDQSVKKRPNSQQKEIDRSYKEKHVKTKSEIERSLTDVTKNGSNNVIQASQKQSDQKILRNIYHLSTQSQSPNQGKDSNSRLYKPLANNNRSISPLLQSKERTVRDNTISGSKGSSKLESYESVEDRGIVIEIKNSTMNIKS